MLIVGRERSSKRALFVSAPIASLEAPARFEITGPFGCLCTCCPPVKRRRGKCVGEMGDLEQYTIPPGAYRASV